MSPLNAARLDLMAEAQRDANTDVFAHQETINPRRRESYYLLWYAKCLMIADAAIEERASGVNPWPVKGEAA